MYVKKIKYTDYNGDEREEKFYFNLNETELTKLQWSVKGGFRAMLEKIIDTQETTKVMPLLEEIITMSYGEKSVDGRRFIKKHDGVRLGEEFLETEAYNKLFVELLNDANKLAEFVNGIVDLPADKQISVEDAKQYLEAR